MGLAKVGCGINVLNFVSLAVAPNMAITSYFKREPKEKKIAAMIFRGMGFYALSFAINQASMVLEKNVTKGNMLAYATLSFCFFGLHCHMVGTDEAEDLGIE